MKVILAIDDSPHSRHLIHSVTKRRWPPDVQFKIVSVVEPLTGIYSNSAWKELANGARERRLKSARDLCHSAREEISAKIPESIVHFEVREGDARHELIDAAVDWAADKMLLGAHSRSICPHNILGSVSRSIVSHAPCSVEVVRERTTASASRNT